MPAFGKLVLEVVLVVVQLVGVTVVTGTVAVLGVQFRPACDQRSGVLPQDLAA